MRRKLRFHPLMRNVNNVGDQFLLHLSFVLLIVKVNIMDGRLEKKSQKELKKLLKKLQKTTNKTRDFYRKTIDKVRETEQSLKKLYSLEKWTKYWTGKKRAVNCPVWKQMGQGVGICAYQMDDDFARNFQDVFIPYCSECKLSKEQAKKGAVLKRVFQNKTYIS